MKRLTEQAWGEWIESLADWEWFATFSFKYPTSPRMANHLWRKHWLRPLEDGVDRQVHFIRVLENESTNIHYHCLMSGIKNQKASIWERAWHNIGGIAKIEPYDCELGGAYYIGRKCAQGCEVAFSKNIERTGLCV